MSELAVFWRVGPYDGTSISGLLKARFDETAEIIIPPPRMPPAARILVRKDGLQ